MTTVLVTGGCGFIGSNFIRRFLSNHRYQIVNLDKLTYAGNLDNLRDVEDNPRYHFVRGDICDQALVVSLFERLASQDPLWVVNFAAETHVDRSLMNPSAFIRTDVHGVFVLLEAARRVGVDRFLQVSTDEVYGDIPPGMSSKEGDRLWPRSPYAASKAGAEMMCWAFRETYGVPIVVTRASNNVGPFQHPEKAVPLFVTNALNDEPIPLYGDGQQVRDWLYVDDHCEALDMLLHRGKEGEAYNIGAGNERPNIDVVEAILTLLGKPGDLVRFVEDRPGHDRRYSLDAAKTSALGWQPRHGFEAAIEKTAVWYRDTRWWWEKIKSGAYREYYQRQYGRRLAEAEA